MLMLFRLVTTSQTNTVPQGNEWTDDSLAATICNKIAAGLWLGGGGGGGEGMGVQDNLATFYSK